MLRPEDFCLVAAVNDDDILSKCLARSPDVACGRLRLAAIHGATAMSHAYNDALDRNHVPIILFAHQDVYLPAGWLDRAIEMLSRLTAAHPDWAVAGPYGVTADGRHVGRVWDATMGRELGAAGFAPAAVGSLDELLLILRRESGVRFDGELPDFHLYGTDIVQMALRQGRGAYAVELPVVHNNRPVATLRGGYARAYAHARRKWREQLPIWTSICALSRWPFALWRAQWRRRHISQRPDALLADAQELARRAGYE